MMLHNEARERLVEGYERTHDAAAYGISKWTVHHLSEQKRSTGRFGTCLMIKPARRWKKSVERHDGFVIVGVIACECLKRWKIKGCKGIAKRRL